MMENIEDTQAFKQAGAFPIPHIHCLSFLNENVRLCFVSISSETSPITFSLFHGDTYI
jgi:hypothetical protein